MASRAATRAANEIQKAHYGGVIYDTHSRDQWAKIIDKAIGERMQKLAEASQALLDRFGGKTRGHPTARELVSRVKACIQKSR